jgi:hypothetical protein
MPCPPEVVAVEAEEAEAALRAVVWEAVHPLLLPQQWKYPK